MAGDDAPTPLAEALAAVAGHFERAAIPGPDAVSHAVLGIRALTQAPHLAVGVPEIESADAVIAAIANAASSVVAAAGERIPFETIALGLSAAQHFANLFRFTPAENATRTPQPLGLDLMDHALLIADVLDADLRRRSIAGRGDLFRRDIAIRRAVADDGADASRQ